MSIPSFQPHEVLVRISVVAQNPTDIKSFDGNRFGDGAVLGCDFCGRVEDVGAEVTRVKRGDRVAGFVGGGQTKGIGAYATYTVTDQRFCFKVPDAISSEAAATVPLALTTAWLAILSPWSLGIDRSKGAKNQILIWGGSSSVGQYAIQIAKYFGFQFATTCTNTEIVKRLGAEHVFNYNSASVVEDIRKTLPDITYVLDCIGNQTSSAQASGVVCDAGGVLCTVQPGKLFTENVAARVRTTDVIVFTAFFKEIRAGPFHIPVRVILERLCVVPG